MPKANAMAWLGWAGAAVAANDDALLCSALPWLALVYSMIRSTYFALTFNYIQFTTGIYVKYRNLHVDHLS